MNTLKIRSSLLELNRKIHTYVHRVEHEIVKEYDHVSKCNVAVIRRVEEDGINVRCTGAHFLWRLLCDGLRRQALMPLLWASKCATYFANIGHAEAGWLAIVTIMGLTGFVAAFLALCLVNFVIGLFCTFALPVGWLSLFAGLVVDVILVRRILEAPHYDSFYWLNS